ncbi:hypothetical protein IWW36_003342 [Coemansia brasiliensis]|uniref:Small ribosomal subunit protein mS29 n=1 Tax=Coemansia brasiliensis TaxID=2650707 RepID=A0A9W8I7Z0_9FUNG|nr:hypothetical protein IWW36_003342 [Coemansia brasiliensis]
MLRTGRIVQSATAARVPPHTNKGCVRMLTTSPTPAKQVVKTDRMRSTAFTRKDLVEKRVRSGTATSVNMANANPIYYEKLPKLHVETLNSRTAISEHAGKIMQIDGSFLQGIGKEHYPGYLGNDFKLFGVPALLYRKFTQDLVDQFNAYKEQGPKRASVLDGKNGIGKSAELMKLASVAASSGCIVIYAHSTVPWVNSSRPYAPQSHNDQFMQLEITSGLLRSIEAVSKDALKKVPLGKALVIGKRNLSEQHTLADLVSFGIHTPALAHDVLEHFLDLVSTQTKVPVLMAIDEVNTFWCSTLYRDQQDQILPANRLRLIRSLLPFFEGEKTLAKGWVLGATSYINPRFMPKELNKKLNPPPTAPLANPELANNPKILASQPSLPFDTIKISGLTAVEAWVLMHFYHRMNVVSTPVTEALVAKKWMVSSGNPRQLFAGVTTFI